MLIDLFDLTDENSKNLEIIYEKIKKESQCPDKITRFTSHVDANWRISINLRLDVLNLFLTSGVYKNIYEVKNERKDMFRKESNIKISAKEAINTHLKEFSNSRLMFDNTFKDGNTFKYCALNIGGGGIKKFGEFCVIIKENKAKEYSTLAFIEEDSLNYVDNEIVNLEKLKQSLANRENVRLLVAQKHNEDICETPFQELSLKICSDSSYIEAVTKEKILDNNIECVRISKKYYDIYYEYLFKDYTGDISEMERLELSVLLSIFKLLEQKGIKNEVEDENDY